MLAVAPHPCVWDQAGSSHQGCSGPDAWLGTVGQRACRCARVPFYQGILGGHLLAMGMKTVCDVQAQTGKSINSNRYFSFYSDPDTHAHIRCLHNRVFL